MKQMLTIGFLWVLMALAVCNPSAEVAEHGRSEEGPNPELSTIDSLMWRQPESALAVLQQFAASPKADSLDELNGHYCQLLISELLYKNDYGQSNRPALQQAVRYFDSLSLCIGVVRNVSTISFLDARAHYINGAGYYECDSVVEACKEYLKALEVMENNFEEKDLVGHKARFMAYTYNRLGDMFSEQFMMEPAITCYENALVYCIIDPTSPQGVSNILSRIGQQYDMKGEKEKAREYYGNAIEEMPSCNNLSYRDLVSIKALSDYRVGLGMEQPLTVLRRIISLADDKSEQYSRSIAIGDIFFEEKMYDSARFYLEPVFLYAEDHLSQVQAAEHLMTIYDSLGENKKVDQCMRFLAQQKKTEGQSKASVSQLEDLFKIYTDRKLQREAEEARKKSIKKTIGIIVPIAVVFALGILVFAKLKNRKLLKTHQEEAKRALEEAGRQHEQELIQQREEALAAERTHRIQQSALSNRLKRSNEELRELKDQIRQQTDSMNPKQEAQALSFNDEPICRLIMERVNEGKFKSKIDYIIYKDSALDKQQLLDLRIAADRHFGQFTVRLKKAYPELTNSDLDYCCLYLLGLTDADIAALMQRTYNTVFERNGKMRKIFDSENPLPITLMGIAKDSLSN